MIVVKPARAVTFAEPLVEVRVETAPQAPDRNEWKNSDVIATLARNVTAALSAPAVTPTRRPMQVAAVETPQQKTWMEKATTAAGIIILIPGTIAALSMLAVIGPPAFGLAFGTAIVGSALCLFKERRNNQNDGMGV
jgi:hypothetical protein